MEAVPERVASATPSSRRKALSDIAKRLGLDEDELMNESSPRKKRSARELEKLAELVQASSVIAGEAIDEALRLMHESNKRFDAMLRKDR